MSDAIIPTEVLQAPGLLEATAIEHDYERAIKGLRAYVSMGLRLMEVKERLPHGKYMEWCETYLPRISKIHLHRAKFVAAGLCQMAGIKCTTRDTFEESLPAEIESILETSTSHRALLATVHQFQQGPDEDRARLECERFFAADPALRDEWEPKVLSGELTWCRAHAGIAGQVATKGGKRADPEYSVLIPQSLKTLGNGFAQWEKLPEEARANTVVEFRKLLAAMPESLRLAIGVSPR